MTIDLNRSHPRPEGHHALTPGFSVTCAAKVVAFLEQAFGAKTLDRYPGPNDTIAHAELKIGDSIVMLGEAEAGRPAFPLSASFYVDNGAAVDATYKRALAAGAKSISEPTNQFYGYRSACVEDAGGNRWTINTIVEPLTKDEILRRLADMKH